MHQSMNHRKSNKSSKIILRHYEDSIKQFLGPLDLPSIGQEQNKGPNAALWGKKSSQIPVVSINFTPYKVIRQKYEVKWI